MFLTSTLSRCHTTRHINSNAAACCGMFNSAQRCFPSSCNRVKAWFAKYRLRDRLTCDETCNWAFVIALPGHNGKDFMDEGVFCQHSILFRYWILLLKMISINAIQFAPIFVFFLIDILFFFLFFFLALLRGIF